jgi:hypothetical protein
MEYDQRVITRPFCKVRTSADEISPWLEAQFGEGTCNASNVRRWRQSVRQRPDDPHELHEEGPSGRPPTEFLDIQILVQQPFHSVDVIAYRLGISLPTIWNPLRESLGMGFSYPRWIRISQQQISGAFKWKLAESCCPISKPKKKVNFADL